MFCNKCIEEGEASIITPSGSSSTSMYSDPYYDGEGLYHNHDANTYSAGYHCSRGHTFIIDLKSGCRNCDYGNTQTVKFLPEKE